MPPSAAVLCLECGSKNKPGWEFCARCGGSLKDAAPATRPRAAAASQAPTGRATPLTGGLWLLGVAVLCAGTWFLFKGAVATSAPNPDIFRVPRSPATPAPGPSAVPESPAVREIRERFAAGDKEGGRRLLAEAVARHPEDFALRLLYAQLLWNGGEKEASLEHYRAAASLDPGRCLDCAKALESMGQTDEALEQYRQAAQRDPGNIVVQRALGNALLAAKRPAEAIAPLRSAAEAAPSDILTAQQLAAALEGAGDLPAAEQAYRTVLGRLPDATVSRGRLAEVLHAQGRGQEAIDVVREGLTRAPNSPNLHRTLGAMLDRAGQKAEAAAAFREFLRLAPNSPEAGLVKQRLAELGESPPAAS